MTSVKAIDIIRPALRRLGAIGATEQPKAGQIAEALDCLNGIIDTWSITPMAALNNTEIVVSLPPSVPSITIGPAQTIDIARPMRIESAYARVGLIDRDIRVATAKEEYDAIILKTVGTTWPELLWYDGGLPTGNVFFWPRASSTVELHVTVLNYLAAYATEQTAQEMAGGYKRALILTTAVEAAPSFQLPVPPLLLQQQQAAVKALKRQNVSVPELDSTTRVESRLGQFLSGGM